MTPFDKIVIVRNLYQIPVSQKIILLVIATRLGNNEFCRIGLTRLQNECCLTRSNTIINLKKLVEQGFIIKFPSDPGYKTNRYSVNFEKITSIGAILVDEEVVSEQYHPSIAAILPQYRSDTSLVSEQYPKRTIKEKEKKIKESALSSDQFSPSEENKILCETLGLNLTDEVETFLSRHKYSKTQPEFAIWMKNSSKYKSQQRSAQPNEVRSTVQFWGPGHPAWESLHGKRNTS